MTTTSVQHSANIVVKTDNQTATRVAYMSTFDMARKSSTNRRDPEKDGLASKDKEESDDKKPKKPLSKRNRFDAYKLCIPLGFLGMHHFYLRRYNFGFIYMFTLGLLGVGWIVDCFRLPWLVKWANERVAHPEMPVKKNLSDAYVLWFPLGFLGLHHYYLGRWRWGITYTCTLGLLLIGWLIDGIHMFKLVKQANKRQERLRTHNALQLLDTDNKTQNSNS